MSLSKGQLKRRKILTAIFHFITSNDKPPTVQNIMDLTGIRSYNTVSRHLKALQEEGILSWEQYVDGKIRVANDAEYQV